jgi:hypothetical protein
MSELLSAKGCLTSEGVALLRAAAPGTAPIELATHVACCARCQDRLLAVERARPADAPKKEPPNLQRTLLLMGAVLFAALAGLFVTIVVLKR